MDIRARSSMQAPVHTINNSSLIPKHHSSGYLCRFQCICVFRVSLEEKLHIIVRCSCRWVWPFNVCHMFQVCIVRRKSNSQMYAMKYTNKRQCLEKETIKNVIREVQILSSLDHPFIISLRFSFQGKQPRAVCCQYFFGKPGHLSNYFPCQYLCVLHNKIPPGYCVGWAAQENNAK